MRDCPAKDNQGGGMMKKIGAKDRPRPLQMCLACPLAPQPMELHLISTPTKPEEKVLVDNTNTDTNTKKRSEVASAAFPC